MCSSRDHVVLARHGCESSGARISGAAIPSSCTKTYRSQSTYADEGLSAAENAPFVRSSSGSKQEPSSVGIRSSASRLWALRRVRISVINSEMISFHNTPVQLCIVVGRGLSSHTSCILLNQPMEFIGSNDPKYEIHVASFKSRAHSSFECVPHSSVLWGDDFLVRALELMYTVHTEKWPAHVLVLSTYIGIDAESMTTGAPDVPYRITSSRPLRTHRRLIFLLLMASLHSLCTQVCTREQFVTPAPEVVCCCEQTFAYSRYLYFVWLCILFVCLMFVWLCILDVQSESRVRYLKRDIALFRLRLVLGYWERSGETLHEWTM